MGLLQPACLMPATACLQQVQKVVMGLKTGRVKAYNSRDRKTRVQVGQGV